MEATFEEVHLWWHPALVIFVSFVPFGALGYLIASSVMMFEYGSKFMDLYQKLLDGKDLASKF